MATTGEELYESEVLWPDHQSPRDVPPPAPARRGPITCPATASSGPVDIPRAAPGAAQRWSGADQGDDGGCGGTMVPPHVMVLARRRSTEGEALSLHTGTGRARRDLSHLRNSVLRMTGFIEG